MTSACIPSTNKYHPFRYALQRPFAKHVSAYWTMTAGTATVPPYTALEGLQPILYGAYNTALEELPFEQRPSNMDLLFDEINRAMTYGMFCAHGRNIFDFDQQLLELFRHTDVGDVPASAIRLPFSVLYLSFGRLEDLILSSSRWVDGAYVYVQTVHGKVWLHVDLSTSSGPEVNRGPTAFVLERDVRYHMPFEISQDRPLSLVLEDALAEEERAFAPPANFQEDFADAAKEAVELGIEIRSGREEGARRRTAALREGFPVFRKAINFVVNALCYLTAYPEGASLEWPADAPVSLTDKADHGSTHKEKRRAESKLLPIGFTRVRFCRLRDAQGPSAIGGVPGIKQHWRRGHWRNQPYGEKRALRKLIWIMPVLVRAESETGLELGHVYSVQSDK